MNSQRLLFVAAIFALALVPKEALAVEALAPQALIEATLSPAQAAALQRLRARPTTRSVSLVQLNASVIRSAPPGQLLQLHLLPQLTLDARSATVRAMPGGRVHWFGQIDGAGSVPAGTASIVIDGLEAMGQITTPDGKTFLIRPIGGGVNALVEVDWSKAPKDDPPRPMPPSEHMQFDLLQPQAAAVPPVIDILVAYTSDAKAAAGSTNLLIDDAIASTQVSLVNSGIAVRVNLIGTLEVAYSEAGRSIEGIIDELDGTNGDALKQIRDRRDSIGADVAVLLVNLPDDKYCGIASRVVADAEHAFIVADQYCAGAYYTFPHELGHIVGARHDMAHDPTMPYEYGHGLQHPAFNHGMGWRTIMAYECEHDDNVPQCDTRVLYWSSPALKFGGAPMGTREYQDNARVWRERARFVAGFRTRR